MFFNSTRGVSFRGKWDQIVLNFKFGRNGCLQFHPPIVFFWNFTLLTRVVSLVSPGRQQWLLLTFSSIFLLSHRNTIIQPRVRGWNGPRHLWVLRGGKGTDNASPPSLATALSHLLAPLSCTRSNDILAYYLSARSRQGS